MFNNRTISSKSNDIIRCGQVFDRMCAQDDGRTPKSLYSVDAKDFLKDEVFGCSIEAIENVIKHKDRRMGIESSCNGESMLLTTTQCRSIRTNRRQISIGESFKIG